MVEPNDLDEDLTVEVPGPESQPPSRVRGSNLWTRWRWRWRFRFRRLHRVIASGNRWGRVKTLFAITVGVGVITGGLRGEEAGVDAAVVAVAGFFTLYLIIELSLSTRAVATEYCRAAHGGAWFALAFVGLSVAWGLLVWPHVQGNLLCSQPRVTGVHITDATPEVDQPITVSLKVDRVRTVEWSVDDSAGDITAENQDELQVTYLPQAVGTHMLRADITATCRATTEFFVPLVVER